MLLIFTVSRSCKPLQEEDVWRREKVEVVRVLVAAAAAGGGVAGRVRVLLGRCSGTSATWDAD
jgi:hypothetical protein